MYDNSVMKPAGEYTTVVKNPRVSASMDLDFIVVRNAPVSILGSIASQGLGLLTINTNNFSTYV